MKVNELLNLAKEIREAMEDSRIERRLDFVEKSHKYSIYNPLTERMTSNLPSVSTLIKKWSEPFDSFNKSIEMMDGDVLLAEELREKWKKMGADASSIGSYAHYKLEQYVWNLFDVDIIVRKPFYDLGHDELIIAQDMLKNGIKLVHTIVENGFVPLDTECIMGSIGLGYFGQCDNLWIGVHNGRIVILMTDYKTNLTKNFETKPWNVPMYEPFGELLDTDLSKYFIQQPLYAQLLSDMLKNTIYKDIPIIGFRVLHLRDGGSSIKVPGWVHGEVKKLYPVLQDVEVIETETEEVRE
tara:strand:- start:6660 stop:7550 length:891 start_codon:yes stop_codon:yes gene_type:complete